MESMARYAEIEDLYTFGLPRGALVTQARGVDSVDVLTNRLSIAGCGFGTATPIQFIADDGGQLPACFEPSTVYYAASVTDSESLFTVSATAGGATIDIPDPGVLPFRVATSNRDMLEQLLDYYSVWLDGKLTAHQTPLTAPYPDMAVVAVAVRTAAHAARALGLGAQGDRLKEQEELLLRDIASLVAGIPIGDSRATGPANKAVFAAYGVARAGRTDSLP